MTYLTFLLFWILPLFLIGSFYFMLRPSAKRKLFAIGIAGLMLTAICYTTPWDNYLVYAGVWGYPSERVLGRLFFVPYEEYLFFILQTGLVGFWCYFVSSWQFIPVPENKTASIKYKGLSLMAGLWLLSLAMIFVDRFRYLALILLWALPVLMLQWGFGASILLAHRKRLAFFILPPMFFLWVADDFAIHQGIWNFSESLLTGIRFWNLPLEEALFFGVTTLFVGAGLLLVSELFNGQVQT